MTREYDEQGGGKDAGAARYGFDDESEDEEFVRLEAEEIKHQVLVLQALLLELGDVDSGDRAASSIAETLRTINQTDAANRENLSTKAARFYEIAQRINLAEESHARSLAIAETLVLISWIADVNAEFSVTDKKQVQARIFMAKSVPFPIREALLIVTYNTLEGEGLNTSDPRELKQVMGALQAEERKHESDDRLKRHIDAILRADPVIVEEYSIDPSQPEWHSVLGWARFYLLNLKNGSNLYSLATNLQQVGEKLQKLGISKEDYVAFLDRAKEKLKLGDSG